MVRYTIQEWDSYLPKGETPVPILYIDPSENRLDFGQYAKENSNKVLVTVTGTGKQYDGNVIPATIHNSAYFPEYRPVFHNKTKWVVLELKCRWIGYPLATFEGKLGHVDIQGAEGPDAVKVEEVPSEAPKPLPSMIERLNEEEQHRKYPRAMNFTQISLSLVIILIFFCIFLFVDRFRNF